MIGVLIVNTSRLICSVIATALKDEPDIHVVGVVTSVDEALNLIRTSNYDVVLASTNLPHNGAFELLRAVKANTSIKVLVMGLSELEEVILRYIEAGAAGYVLREDSVDDLLKNIRAAHGGEALVSPEITAALMARIAQLAELRPPKEYETEEFTDITPREREVLDLIGEGLSNQEIANRLVIELGTVKNHVHSILQKLDVSSRQDAAMYWDAIQDS
jgi:DNA-binding NarL/FixJ family response regulator